MSAGMFGIHWPCPRSPQADLLQITSLTQPRVFDRVWFPALPLWCSAAVCASFLSELVTQWSSADRVCLHLHFQLPTLSYTVITVSLRINARDVHPSNINRYNIDPSNIHPSWHPSIHWLIDWCDLHLSFQISIWWIHPQTPGLRKRTEIPQEVKRFRLHPPTQCINVLYFIWVTCLELHHSVTWQIICSLQHHKPYHVFIHWNKNSWMTFSGTGPNGWCWSFQFIVK